MSGIVNSAGSKSGVIGQIEMDIEQGTWGPATGSQVAMLSIAASAGTYTKIKNHVWVTGTMWGYDGPGTIVGNDVNGTITTLPFAIVSHGGAEAEVPFVWQVGAYDDNARGIGYAASTSLYTGYGDTHWVAEDAPLTFSLNYEIA